MFSKDERKERVSGMVMERVKYVLVNMRKEVKDPEIIYKKYER